MKTPLSSGGNCLLAGLMFASLGGGAALASEEFTEALERTYPLSAGGRINLDNVNGAVRISVWERAEVKLEAVKRAKKKAELEQVTIDISAKPDRLKIHTQYPNYRTPVRVSQQGQAGK